MKQKELKFRIWDTEKFTYSDTLTYIGLEAKSEKFRNISQLSFLFGSILANKIVDKVVIQQYTGLKDKNGKEIYEGDIVVDKIYNDPNIKQTDNFIVAYYSGAFRLDVIWGGYGGVEIENMQLLKADRLEIIGNVFETPELLTSKLL